jgi:hypothetical protein
MPGAMFMRPRRSIRVAAIRTFWSELRRTIFDPYRPERHYMRGPGPKWYALHSHARPHNHK